MGETFSVADDNTEEGLKVFTYVLTYNKSEALCFLLSLE